MNKLEAGAYTVGNTSVPQAQQRVDTARMRVEVLTDMVSGIQSRLVDEFDRLLGTPLPSHVAGGSGAGFVSEVKAIPPQMKALEDAIDRLHEVVDRLAVTASRTEAL